MARVWIESVDEDATEIDVFPFGSLAMLAVPKPSLARRIAAPAVGALIALVAIVVIQLASGASTVASAAPPIVERLASTPAAAEAPIVVATVSSIAEAELDAPPPAAEPAPRTVAKKSRVQKANRSRGGRKPVRVDASTPLGVLRPR